VGLGVTYPPRALPLPLDEPADGSPTFYDLPFSHNTARLAYHIQARREGGVGGKLLRAPRRLSVAAVGQKYKVRQNVPY